MRDGQKNVARGRWMLDAKNSGCRGKKSVQLPAMRLLYIFRQMDAKYSGYRGVLARNSAHREQK